MAQPRQIFGERQVQIVTMRLPIELIELIDRHCEQQDIVRSDWMRMAFLEKLQK